MIINSTSFKLSKPRVLVSVALSLLMTLSAIGQDCNCLTSEVMSNAVAPCELSIGTITTVATTSELQSAINLANNSGGDMTILIEDGTYPIASTSQYPYITASNVVFRSVSGNRDAVIITGQGMLDVAPDTEIGIYAVGDNITIADLTIRDLGNHGIAVTGDNLFVHNVRFQDTYEQMIKGNSAGDGADNGIVQCSLFEYTAGMGPQWYIGGLDIHQGNDWVVSDNVFYDIASPSQALAEHAVHFWDNSADNTVERNVIVGCDRGVGFGLGASPNSGGIIRNNMIYNDGSTPFHDVGISLETSPNTKVYNNSIMIQYQNAIEYRFAETVNAHIVNNVCNQAIASRNGGQAILETNNENSIPSWFLNPAAGDLRLATAQTELVDQGTDLGTDVQDDLDKNPRPLNGGFDIGAQEFQGPNSIEDLQPLSFRLYPIPARDIIHFESMDQRVSVNLQLLDGLGRIIESHGLIMSDGRFTLPISDLENGVYYCRIFFDDGLHEDFPIVVFNE